jgi:hypothetical protein
MNNLFECKVFRHTIRLKAIQRSSKDDIHASLFRPHEERHIHMLVEDHNRRLCTYAPSGARLPISQSLRSATRPRPIFVCGNAAKENGMPRRH